MKSLPRGSLDRFFHRLGISRRVLRRSAGIVGLCLLLVICVPAFSAINELYLALNSMAIAQPIAPSDEQLMQFQQDDTDTALSDTDIGIVYDADAAAAAFLEANKEPINTDETGIINILLIGCDSTGYEGYLRSDSMIILSIDPERSSIKLISLMRDMRVRIGNGYDKLNAAFAYDSSGQLLLDTIEQNFLLDIDDFICINYRAFRDAVDALGGVRVTVDEGDIRAINKCISNEDYHLTFAGEQLLNGTQALGYCQMRSVGTDIARTARQRAVMTELLSMAQEMSITEMTDIISAVFPNVLTNMSQGKIFWLALEALSMEDIRVEQMRIPIDHSWEDVIVDQRWYIAFNHRKNVNALHEMIYGDAERAAAEAQIVASPSDVHNEPKEAN